MAQTGYTPIVLYNSTTANAVPTTSNLQSGELALNIADSTLYFNRFGTIEPLAGKNIAFQTTNYSIVEIGGVLVFQYQGNTIATLNSVGSFTAGI